MADNLAVVFGITLVGMGLVFAGILLVMLMMSLLVRLSSRRESTDQPSGQTGEVLAPALPSAADLERRQLRARAAAIAVALALARDQIAEPNVFPPPPTAIISAWQAVMRGRQLKQRGPVR